MPGQELADPVDRVIGDAGEDVTQVGFGVDAVQFAGFDQAVDDGCAVATGIGAGEEPVFPAEGDAAQGVFSAVVVDLQAAVLGITGQRRPVGRGVADRLGEAALGRQPGELRLEPNPQGNEPGLGLLLPDVSPSVGWKAADCLLDHVKLANLLQGLGINIDEKHFLASVGKSRGEGNCC
jgi:hypothetical protein